MKHLPMLAKSTVRQYEFKHESKFAWLLFIYVELQELLGLNIQHFLLCFPIMATFILHYGLLKLYVL